MEYMENLSQRGTSIPCFHCYGRKTRSTRRRRFYAATSKICSVYWTILPEAPGLQGPVKMWMQSGLHETMQMQKYNSSVLSTLSMRW